MARVKQKLGLRGSLKWVQIVVNQHPDILDEALKIGSRITWLSPKADDGFAEYSDAEFLEIIGCNHLSSELLKFWPKRGPQWDALARTDKGEVLIVEAKAHIPELFSPPSTAGAESRTKIDVALRRTSEFLHATSSSSWGVHFYQLCNRLAHLMFLREHGMDAKLVLLNFIGDSDMNGPETAAEWEAAYSVAYHVLGLPKQHKLSRHVLHCYVDVRSMQG